MDEKKLRKSWARSKNKLDNKLKQIEQWLCNPQLEPWAIKLEELNRKIKGHVSFFSLFDISTNSVPTLLRKKELGFTYFLHLKGSMILHGSTMEHFLWIGDSTVAPNIIPDKDDVNNDFEIIISTCNNIFFLLTTICHFP